MRYRNLLLIGMMFILMVGLVSADLIHEWKFEDNLVDDVNSVTLVSQNTPTYVTSDIETSEGIQITTGGIDTPWRVRTDISNLEYSLYDSGYYTLSAWVVLEDYTSNVAGFIVTYGSNAGGIANNADRLTCGNSDNSNPYVSSTSLYGELIHVVLVQNGTLMTGYYNNTKMALTGPVFGGLMENGIFQIGSYDNGRDIIVYDVQLYNESLNDDQVENLFLYNSITEPLPSHNYSLTLTQEPLDLNLASVGDVNISLNVVDSTGTIPNSSSASINYITYLNNGSVSEICYLYNDSCQDINFTNTMTKINNSDYYNVIDENKYLPAFYPFDIDIIETVSKSDDNIYNDQSLMFNVVNVPTSKDYYLLEYNIEPYSVALSQPLHIYKCQYLNSSNCSLIDVVLASETPAHTHSDNSSHYTSLIPLIDNENFSIKFDVPTSPPVNKGWNFKYFLNASYLSSDIFTLSSDGVTFTNTSNIYDIHIHAFDSSLNFTYNTTFNDGDGIIKYISGFDDLDITNFPPSGVDIFNPTGTITLNSTGVDVFFNWSTSFDANNDTVYYKVNLNGVNLTSYNTSTNSTLTLFSTDYTSGEYETNLYLTDLEDTTLSIQEIPFNLCINNWVSTEQICIDGVSNNTYSDSNSCPIEYEKPDSFLTNCSIEEDNSTLTLIILWVLFGLLSMYMISRGVFVGWFFLGITIMMFTFTSLQTITDEPMLIAMGYIFSLIFMALSLTKGLFD